MIHTFVRNPWLPEGPVTVGVDETPTTERSLESQINDLQARLSVLLNEWALWTKAQECVDNIRAELERLGVPSEQIHSIGV